MHTEIDVDVPTQAAGATVPDRTAPHSVDEAFTTTTTTATTMFPGADSGRLTVTEADVLAPVDPVAPVDVFFTPPAGLPVAPVAEGLTTAAPSLAAARTVGPVDGPSAAGPSRRERRRTRRRTRLVVLAVGAAWAVALVGVVAYVVAREDGDTTAATPAAASVADSTAPDNATPPAPAPSDDPAAAADDDAADDAAVGGAAAGDATDAQQAVRSYIATRGTEAERAFSSQGGRDELDAVIADLGPAVPQGDATCTAVGVASFTCVQDTDQGPITFTVGPDPDDPATSGLEVVGAATA